MRIVEPALEIRPDGGHGSHVFAGANARLLEDRYDIDPADIITFDHRARPAQRHEEVKEKLHRRAAVRPPGYYRSIIRRMHGYPMGAQDGVRAETVHEEFEALDGRIATDVTVVNYSCSNAATIGRNPDGDMSLADAQRDVLCEMGYVDCQTFGHLIAGHGDYEIADKAGKKDGQRVWRPLARWFRGGGTTAPKRGGEDVLPLGHHLLDDLYRMIRKFVDPDGPDGPEDMIGFWAVVPWLESRDELISWLQPTHDLLADTGRSAPPTVSELQQALVKWGAVLVVDGKMGRRTRASIVAFQLQAGLKGDGIPGPKTWAALRAARLLD